MEKFLLILSFFAGLSCATKNLVLVGGALADGSPIYGKIVSLAGGAGRARIGIISCASDDPWDAYEAYAENFVDVGASAFWIPITINNVSEAEDKSVIQLIDTMTGFFFSGGDQSRLIDCFIFPNNTDTPALLHIKDIWKVGGVISGTSAGTTIQQGQPMITSGNSWNSLVNGTFTSDDWDDDVTYRALGGFEIFTYGLLDTHFGVRGRQGRMIRLASDAGVPWVYGVDENTALVVRNIGSFNSTTGGNTTMDIMGENGVYIFDLRDAVIQYTNDTSNNSYWGIYGVRATYLTSSDGFDPNSFTAVYPSWKAPVEVPTHERASTSNDVFSSPYNPTQLPEEFTRIATHLILSMASETTGVTYETDPSFRVTLRKDQSTRGFSGYSEQIEYTSFENLIVDIQFFDSSSSSSNFWRIVTIVGSSLALGFVCCLAFWLYRHHQLTSEGDPRYEHLVNPA